MRGVLIVALFVWFLYMILLSKKWTFFLCLVACVPAWVPGALEVCAVWNGVGQIVRMGCTRGCGWRRRRTMGDSGWTCQKMPSQVQIHLYDLQGVVLYIQHVVMTLRWGILIGIIVMGSIYGKNWRKMHRGRKNALCLGERRLLFFCWENASWGKGVDINAHDEQMVMQNGCYWICCGIVILWWGLWGDLVDKRGGRWVLAFWWCHPKMCFCGSQWSREG